MKDIKVIIGVLGFVIGVSSISIWKKYNYVSIPKENSQRSIASKSTGQQLVIDDFTKKIIAMKTKADVDKTAKYISETSKNYPDFVGVQLFSATADILPKLKGIVWRLRGIVEHTDILHSYILSNLRFFYVSRYAYGPHIRALFHYLVDPNPGDIQFKNISALQAYLSNRIRPALLSVLERSKQSLTLPARNHHFSFDRTIYVGSEENKRYFDSKEASKEYIKPYTSYVISGIARTIGSIDYFTSYNFDDTTKIMKKVLKKSSINSIFGRFKFRQGRRSKDEVKSLPHPVTRKDFVKIVRKFKKFGTPRLDLKATQFRLDSAYQMFALAAEHDIKGYVCSIKYASMMMNGEDIGDKYDCSWGFMEAENFLEEEYFIVGGSKFLVDPNLLLINHRQDFHELNDRYRIYHPKSDDGIVSITSDATGGVVQINAKGAFTAQSDLKDFLPVSFAQSIEFDDVKIEKDYGAYSKNGQWTWNYDYGRPTAWKDSHVSFGGLFPEATNDNIYEIMYHVRLTRSLRPFSNLFTTVP